MELNKIAGNVSNISKTGYRDIHWQYCVTTVTLFAFKINAFLIPLSVRVRRAPWCKDPCMTCSNGYNLSKRNRLDFPDSWSGSVSKLNSYNIHASQVELVIISSWQTIQTFDCIRSVGGVSGNIPGLYGHIYEAAPGRYPINLKQGSSTNIFHVFRLQSS